MHERKHFMHPLPPPRACRKKVIDLDKQKVGNQLKALREEIGFTQEELSKKANISRNYLIAIERGRHSPSVEILDKLAVELNTSLLYLLNDRVEDMESRVLIEQERLKKLFSDIPKNQLEIAEGLVTQAARLRILLDDNWRDILENGEYEKFSQSENQKPYDRKRPIVENYDNRDKTYKDIVKQLNDLLPRQNLENKSAVDKVLGR